MYDKKCGEEVIRRLTTQDVTWFLDLNSTGRLELDPSYQRKSVWTRRDRQYFLDTIFNNYPSPAIFLHKDLDESGIATYNVVDGKQRLETILEFVNNRLPLKDNIGDTRLAGKRWRDLDAEPELKRRLWDYQFTVEMLDSIEPAVVNDVFGRLNQNSRKLMPQEIRHSRYNGWLISLAEAEAERPVWKQLKVSTAARARRMQDVQFISELLSVSLLRQISGFDQDSLEELYATYEDPELIETGFNPEEFVAQFERDLSYITEMDEQDDAVSSHATTFAHLYSLWAWAALAETRPTAKEAAAKYIEFMAAVNSYLTSGEGDGLAVVYADNSRGASTDLKQRTERHRALSSFLNSH